MSYMALYRKWRPKTFDEVIGQQHIIKTLRNQIKANRIGHAYLFCGTRGTGKTSTAKLFAKAVNCLNPIDGNPCNECESCTLIKNNQSMNVIEIDAASNNSVDNIREIREEVKYTPANGKYKVYIIDEVHMLSVGAFNALLKTLEEPPAHVIFILATTEPQKILATILSRCQRYDFKRISSQDIASRLKFFMSEEHIEIEDNAINYIARLADGAMRDALSILDQCIAFYLGQKITLDKVLDVLGAVDIRVFFEMTDALNEKNATRSIELVDKIMLQGRDLRQFVLDFITHLRNLLVIQTIQNDENILDLSDEDFELLKEQSTRISAANIVKYIKQFSLLEAQLKYASLKRILLEVTLIKLCQVDMDQSYEGLVQRINQLEQKVKQGIKIVQTQPMGNIQGEQKKKLISKPKPKAVPEEVKKIITKWPSIKETLSKGEPGLKANLSNVQAKVLEGDILYLVCETSISKDLLVNNKEERLNLIKKGLETYEGKSFEVRVLSQTEYDTKYLETYGESINQVDAESNDNNYPDLNGLDNINFNVEYEE